MEKEIERIVVEVAHEILNLNEKFYLNKGEERIKSEEYTEGFLNALHSFGERVQKQEQKKILTILDDMEDKTSRNVVLFHLTPSDNNKV